MNCEVFGMSAISSFYEKQAETIHVVLVGETLGF